MKVDIKEESKDKLLFNIDGEDHTLCNLLVKKLNENKDVIRATYSIDHPLVGIPEVMVEAKDAKAAVKKAIADLLKSAEELNKEASKL